MAKNKRKPGGRTADRTAGYVPLATQLLGLIADSGMTINAVALASGIPQPVLQRFTSGERDNVRIDTADKLCEFFGVRLTATKRKPKVK
ncbi:MAG: helix-turn-helix transcriptional regulator [Thermoguttaceae bacterium]|jgi:DNA-binding Xre family transcriptional regulator